MQFTIKKLQDDVTKSIKNIKRAISQQGRRKLLTIAGSSFLKMTQDNFGSSGQYRDATWSKLSPAYAKKVGSTTATLLRSKTLKDSIKMSTPKGNYVEIYSDNAYVAAHMLGSPKQNIPKRNMFPVQFLSPSYIKLLEPASRELGSVISRQLVLASAGALPLLSSNDFIQVPAYGSVFSSPQ